MTIAQAKTRMILVLIGATAGTALCGYTMCTAPDITNRTIDLIAGMTILAVCRSAITRIDDAVC